MLAAGSIDTRTDRVAVRVTGQFTTEEDIRNVADRGRRQADQAWRLPTVRRGYEDPSTYTMRHNGQQVLMLAVTMTDDGNVVGLGGALEKAVAQGAAELPARRGAGASRRPAGAVEEAVWEFERSFLEALAIVLAVASCSLGWRTGIVVALSVPLVLGAWRVVHAGLGWTCTASRSGALIIALGLLVDDAIIAVEMMVLKLEG